MGTPLPPNEPGTPCTRCFGIGKAFGDVSTPKFITVQLHDLQPGDFWDPDDEQELLTPTLLSQAGLACDWNLGTSAFTWIWAWRGAGSTIIIQHTPTNKRAFESFAAPNCLLEYSSDLVVPANNFTFAGRITMDWNTEGL